MSATTAGSLTSRQRLQATLNHRQPDRVCVDFGATPVTGIHVSRRDPAAPSGARRDRLSVSR